ncbi:MAG: guanylate kinase [Candidatus Brocadiae bacterium]|nr:guanylate kinase [Candidatus Brocadiia bacterium]
MGKVIIISGPAGVGKNTVADQLCRQVALRRVVTATTRKARPGETDGRDYIFLSEEEFRQRLANGEFLEHAEVHGNLYGTPRDQVDEALAANEDCLLLIDVQGAMQVKAVHPDAMLIFLDAPDTGTLGERLAERSTEDEDERRRRLETAAAERQYRNQYDHSVVNDELARTVTEVRHLVTDGRRHDTGGQD